MDCSFFWGQSIFFAFSSIYLLLLKCLLPPLP
nr:MAG TPA: hypothetical protein [Caudoviricetes sp.]